MPFATSHGRAIYSERHGDGPAVVFLHGAGSNAATWWQQLPAFTAAHTCVTLDIRCFGRSVAPLQEFALPLFVDDVLAILDREHIARAALVGQSLGGMIGLQLALRHPARVAAPTRDRGRSRSRGHRARGRCRPVHRVGLRGRRRRRWWHPDDRGRHRDGLSAGPQRR